MIRETQIKNQMGIELVKALKSLAGYKFLMFGYHAANWVNLNKLLPVAEKEPNPFQKLVKDARFLLGIIDPDIPNP